MQCPCWRTQKQSKDKRIIGGDYVRDAQSFGESRIQVLFVEERLDFLLADFAIVVAIHLVELVILVIRHGVKGVVHCGQLHGLLSIRALVHTALIY